MPPNPKLRTLEINGTIIDDSIAEAMIANKSINQLESENLVVSPTSSPTITQFQLCRPFINVAVSLSSGSNPRFTRTVLPQRHKLPRNHRRGGTFTIEPRLVETVSTGIGF